MYFVIGFLLLLVSCVTPQTVWHHDAKQRQDFFKDKTDCRAKSTQGCGVQGTASCIDVAFDECMMGEGWYKVSH